MCSGSSNVSAGADADPDGSAGHHDEVIDRRDRDLDQFPGRAFGRHRYGDHVVTRRAEPATDLVITCHHPYLGAISSELDERLRQHDDEGQGSGTDGRLVAGCASDRRDGLDGQDDITHPILTYNDEVGPDRGDDPSGRAPTHGSYGHRATSFPEIDQHPCERRLLRGLSFQPTLAGPSGGRGVDSPLCDPTSQTGQGVVDTELYRLFWRVRVHEFRGYRYHLGDR